METRYNNHYLGQIPDTDRGYTVYNDHGEMAWSGSWWKSPQHGIQLGTHTVSFRFLREAKLWIDNDMPLKTGEHLVFATSREEAELKLRKHLVHVDRQMYLGGCETCQWEQRQKLNEVEVRPIALLAYIPPVEFGPPGIAGILKGAETREDYWEANPSKYPSTFRLSEAETEAALRRHIWTAYPLARDAEWVSPSLLRLVREGLSKGRVSRSDPDSMYFNWNPVLGGRDMNEDGNLI